MTTTTTPATPELLARWAATPPPVGPETDHERQRWLSRLADADLRARVFFTHDDDTVHALLGLHRFRDGRYRLGRIRTASPPDERAAALIHAAIARARDEGARLVGMRLPVEHATPPILRAVTASGGRFDGGRIEFRRDLRELPREAPHGPLRWREARDRDQTAALYVRTSEGSDDGLEPGEDPRETVDAWRTGPLRCAVHTGSLDGVPVALVCAHADTDGPPTWSGLAWMGLVPEARGRGLGHAVHAHGLSLLRRLGGTVYHGGTSLDNAPMRACFARQDVPELCRFDRLRWDLP
ncbi:MAG: GNAT family N-acetyltransferase [Myxococcota bacterium]